LRRDRDPLATKPKFSGAVLYVPHGPFAMGDFYPRGIPTKGRSGTSAHIEILPFAAANEKGSRRQQRVKKTRMCEIEFVVRRQRIIKTLASGMGNTVMASEPRPPLRSGRDSAHC
jgi:hypothetical protein